MFNISIGAILKHDSTSLKEWIEYHRLIGVDHFYLYDNANGKLNYELKNYIEKGIVTLVKWPNLSEEQLPDFVWALSTQVSAYENAILRGVDSSKWLVFLDINEYLVPNDNLKEILATYHDKPGLKISSTCFENSIENGCDQLIIESFMLTNPPKIKPEKCVSKTIFKPALCKGFNWPPYDCILDSDQKPVRLSKSELSINKYVLPTNKNHGIGKYKGRIEISPHILTDETTQDLLNDGYEIEDQDKIILKYIPKLTHRMSEVLNVKKE